jgi:hypothetical protein
MLLDKNSKRYRATPPLEGEQIPYNNLFLASRRQPELTQEK